MPHNNQCFKSQRAVGPVRTSAMVVLPFESLCAGTTGEQCHGGLLCLGGETRPVNRFQMRIPFGALQRASGLPFQSCLHLPSASCHAASGSPKGSSRLKHTKKIREKSCSFEHHDPDGSGGRCSELEETSCVHCTQHYWSSGWCPGFTPALQSRNPVRFGRLEARHPSGWCPRNMLCPLPDIPPEGARPRPHIQHATFEKTLVFKRHPTLESGEGK